MCKSQFWQKQILAQIVVRQRLAGGLDYCISHPARATGGWKAAESHFWTLEVHQRQFEEGEGGIASKGDPKLAEM
jgi:hypothetical protein